MVVTKLHNLIIISITGLLGSPTDVRHTILGRLGWGGAELRPPHPSPPRLRENEFVLAAGLFRSVLGYSTNEIS